MLAPHHPEAILPVTVREGGVVREGPASFGAGPTRRQVAGRGRDLRVVVGDVDVGRRGGQVCDRRQRQRQHRQRHRRLELFPSLHDVVKHLTERRILPHHPEGPDRGTIVGLGVVEQNIRLGREAGAGDDVEVVAQCIGLAADHQGMFFIRVVARLGRIVLRVNRALGLKAVEAAAAGVVGHHDRARGGVGPGQRVAPDDGRPIDRLKAVAGIPHRIGRVLPEPPDLERVRPGNRVHRDDRPRVGVGETLGERILVGSRMERSPAALKQVAGKIIARVAHFAHRRVNAAAHVGGLVEVTGRTRLGQVSRRELGSAIKRQVAAIAAAVVGHPAAFIERELHLQARRAGRVTAGLHVLLELVGRPGRGPDAKAVELGLRQGVGAPVGLADEIRRPVGVRRRFHGGGAAGGSVNVNREVGSGAVEHRGHMHPLVERQRRGGVQSRPRAGDIVSRVELPGGAAGQGQQNILGRCPIAAIQEPRPVSHFGHVHPRLDRVAAAIEVGASRKLAVAGPIERQRRELARARQHAGDVGKVWVIAPHQGGAER